MGLAGPLAEGNAKVNKIGIIFSSAQEDHDLFHTNTNKSHAHYHIPLKEARQVVHTCSICAPLHQRSVPAGSNFRGLNPNEPWQADFTHFSLPCTTLLFVVIDTYSGLICATTATSKSAKAAIHGLLAALSVVGLPLALKTDNGPAFTSAAFSSFLNDWGFRHIRGIPYNPQGQAIIERAHHTLKLAAKKLKGGGTLGLKYGIKNYLPLILFTINF